jgi:uncharacterized protein (TIGR04255 family)
VGNLKDHLEPAYEELRKEFKANTLVNVMLRLDFNPLITAEKLASFLQDELCAKGFDYQEDFLQESEMRLNDPIEKDDRIFPKQLENERVYRFILDGKIFSFSRFFLIYQVSPFSNNFSEDIEYFSYLITKIKEISPYLNIKRLGIRKTNLVIAENFNQLFKCFKKEFLPLSAAPKVPSNEFGIFESKENFFSSEYQLSCNIRKRLESGEMQFSNDKKELVGTKDVLRFILELETYSRGENYLTNAKDHVDKLSQMNAAVFFLYLETLTDDFISQLKSGSTEGLFAGVNLNVGVQKSG